DRFLLKINIVYPPPEEEDRILRLYQGRGGLGHPLDILKGPTDDGLKVSREAILAARRATGGVVAKPEVCAYIGQIARPTPTPDKVLMGASSRASVHLLQASKGRAVMRG